ncbi:toxin-activating lysine-acyltransferase [Anianabacter salinae]|uniref:toxin-activating lysine-acyltransferase n=1 Tax=Anianabacter salinae TaxID=2851023 RepID=UPI00225E1107|nr:toxin-activating lysine-acyltransferase [Anianabacter salinae]MBV0913531.1 toxin-activating lysine-acyltransferase [Anianabacter salinae]
MTGLIDQNGLALPPVEAPSEEQLRVFGDLLFLAFRSPRHTQMPLGTLRSYIEPPVHLGQFRIFRFDEVPRGMYTWGWLSDDAARRLVKGMPLAPEDWHSGDNLWIVDMIAPYKGLTASIVRWIMEPGNFTEHSFFFRRVSGVNETRRIVHIDFRRRALAKVMTHEAFLRRKV